MKKHPIEAKRAEPILADEFEAQYTEDTSTWALNIIDAYYSSDRSYLSNRAKADLGIYNFEFLQVLLPAIFVTAITIFMMMIIMMVMTD